MAKYSLDNPPSMVTIYDEILFEFEGARFLYSVEGNHLRSQNRFTENDHFLLALFPSGREAFLPFLQKAYGYPAGIGCWPIYQNLDFLAATRVIWYLFSEIQKRKKVPLADNYISIELELENLKPHSPPWRSPEEANEILTPFIGVIHG